MLIRKKQILAIYLFLTLITLIAFWQVSHCDFISYDDPKYVTENIHIRQGITIQAIRWAFTTVYASNWHPLTWMSHMLDVQLFGLNPHGHHLINLLFHISNSLLLFFVFHRITKAPWKSAFVAALFALHPLHVESVAWVAERKDVLAAFFWMLTMAAYIHYVERRTEDKRQRTDDGRQRTEDGRRRTEDGRRRTEDGEKWTGIFHSPSSVLRYLAVLTFYALGLMAKPMLVTLPFVLLLLDYWPLQRFEQKTSAEGIRTEVSKQGAGSGEQGARSETQNPKLEQKPRSANKRKSGKRSTDQGIVSSSVLRPAASQKIGRELGTHKIVPRLEASTSGQNVKPGPERSEGPAFYARSERSPRTRNAVRVPSSVVRPLLWEKLPLFALAALSCIVTFIAQQKGGAVKSIQIFTPGVRIANALVSYILYIRKMIWPADLAFFYPHPRSLPLWQVLGAALLLIAVTSIVIRKAKRYPFLPVGWLWFTGTLVPVIGVVQVGGQAMADRYTYIPLIGLFSMAAWGIPALFENWRYRKEALFTMWVLALPCLFVVTWAQLGYWRNSIALCDHTLKVTDHNDTVHTCRGTTYAKLGNYRQAIEDYDKAIQINPAYALAYLNRGVAYGHIDNQRQAISDFDRAIEINPVDADEYFSRGIAYVKLGNQGQAVLDFDRAIQINPEYALAYINRGIAYVKLGNYRQAIGDYDKALVINPENALAYLNRGVAYNQIDNQEQAISDFDKAIEINPGYADAYNYRGMAYGKLGNHQNAILDFDKAVEINPEYAGAYINRGIVYSQLGNQGQAIADFDRTIQINPDFAVAYYYRGFAYGQLGNQRQETEDLQKAARLGNEDAKNLLKSQGANR
ncbi:MAG: tetratricopeptide repeat protein [Syntrophobacteraceae bacterium]